MEKTYLWRIPDDYPQSLIGEYQEEDSPDRFLFKTGTPLPSLLAHPVIRFEKTVKELSIFDCLCNSAMVPLISNSVANELNNLCPGEVEFVKAKVIGSDGTLDSYFILNATKKISCVNREHSDYRCIAGTEKILSFRKLAHYANCLGKYKIARDIDYLSHLVVSNAIKDLVMKKSFTGIALIEPSEIPW